MNFITGSKSAAAAGYLEVIAASVIAIASILISLIIRILLMIINRILKQHPTNQPSTRCERDGPETHAA